MDITMRITDLREYEQGDVDLLQVSASVHNREGKLIDQADGIDLQSATLSFVLQGESAAAAKYRRGRTIKVTVQDPPVQ